MHNEQLSRLIKRKSLVRLLLSLPIVAAGILLAFFIYDSGLVASEGFFTPHAVTTLGDMAAVVNKPLAEGGYRIQLKVDAGNLADTGISQIEDHRRTGNYLAALVDGRYVLCLISKEQYDSLQQGQDFTFTGFLTHPDGDVVDMVLDDMIKEGVSENEAKALLYDHSIDTIGDGIMYRIILYALSAFLIIFGIRMLIRGLVPCLNVLHYRYVRKLAVYGPLENTWMELEQQYAVAGQENTLRMKKKGGSKVTLLSNWIVIEGPMDVRFVQANNMLWAYKLTIQRKYYGVTASRYFVKLVGVHSIDSLEGGDEKVAMLLEAIAELYPWAVIGYYEELDRTWKSDRRKFIELTKAIQMREI